MNDLDALLAAANPVAAADLTYGPRQETLLRSIIDEPNRQSPARPGARRRWMLPAVAAALAITAVLWHVLVPQRIPEQRYVTSGGAHAILLAAAEHADQTGTKRFWHSKGEVGQLLRRDHDGHRYTLLVTTPTEIWEPRDPIDGIGVSSYDIGGGTDPAGQRGRRRGVPQRRLARAERELRRWHRHPRSTGRPGTGRGQHLRRGPHTPAR